MTTTHDPEPYYLWSHPRETARVCRPSQASFAAGEPEWVREYPVEAVGVVMNRVFEGLSTKTASLYESGKSLPLGTLLYAHPLPVQGEARQQAALEALADSTQELGGYEVAKPDVEHLPDDMEVPKPTSDLDIGDYVFACRWGDGEPGDPWAVGWIEEIDLTPVTPFVTLKGMPRGWRRAMKITEEQGHRICALYPPAEELSHQERLAARAEAFGLATFDRAALEGKHHE